MKYLFIFSVWALMSVSAMGESQFAESSIGIAVHNIDVDGGPSISTLGEYLSFSVGVKAKHSLSMMGSVRLWNTEDEDNDPAEHVLFHDFHFTGLSLGLDAQFFLPTLNKGPYVKLGRHCWSANVRQVFNVWNGSGCSNLAGAGLMLGGMEGGGGNMFAEILLTRFERINSWMIAFGVRF